MRGLKIATVVALGLVCLTPARNAEAARLCKDGFVTYAGSATAPSREAAEASARRAWRAVAPSQYFLSEANRATAERMECVRSSAPVAWRCFIRTSRCSKA